jgi:SAM-dependent methyltransferase
MNFSQKDLNMATDELIPPVEMMFDGATSVEEFINVGKGFCERYVIGHAKLAPYDRVLDVGSGIGQKARFLTTYLDHNGSYEGFDIVPKGVEWCNEKYKRFDNFHFQLADIYSAHYNPTATTKASEYRFPFEDSDFDIVFLASVFTHMVPQDMRHYLTEIARVLKPGGRCVISYFLLNPESRKRVALGLDSIKIPYTYTSETCRVADLKSPETIVAHDERTVRDLYEENGLSITALTYGYWCGRKEFIGALQDVIVAVKE